MPGHYGKAMPKGKKKKTAAEKKNMLAKIKKKK